MVNTLKSATFPIIGLILVNITLLSLYGYREGLFGNNGPLWPDHYPLLVSDRTPLDRVDQLLQENQINYISAGNAPLYYTTFAGLAEISVSELETLHPDDPRLTPYMALAETLFLTESKSKEETYHIIYLGKEESYRSVSHILKEGGVEGVSRLASDRMLTLKGALSLLLFLAGAVGVAVVKNRGKRLFSLFGGLSLVPPLLAVSSPYSLGLALSAYALFLAIGIEKNRLKATSLLLAIGAGSFTLLFLVLTSLAVDSSLLVLILALSLTTPALILFAFKGWPNRREPSGNSLLPLLKNRALLQKRKSHPIFIPVPLISPKQTEQNSLPLSLFLAYSLMILLSLFFEGKGFGVSLPYPVKSGYHYTIEGVNNLAQKKGREEPLYPTVVDLVTHRAYQDGLLYNFPYRLPKPQEPITISNYHFSGNKIREERETLFVFDDQWLTAVLEEERAGGVGKLILGDTKTLLSIESVKSSHKASQNLFVIFFLLFFILLIAKGKRRIEKRGLVKKVEKGRSSKAA